MAGNTPYQECYDYDSSKRSVLQQLVRHLVIMKFI